MDTSLAEMIPSSTADQTDKAR